MFYFRLFLSQFLFCLYVFYSALAFVSRFYDSVVPEMSTLEPCDTEFLAQVNQLIGAYVNYFEACQMREALRQILSISRLGNGYFQVNQPWAAYKKEETK